MRRRVSPPPVPRSEELRRVIQGAAEQFAHALVAAVAKADLGELVDVEELSRGHGARVRRPPAVGEQAPGPRRRSRIDYAAVMERAGRLLATATQHGVRSAALRAELGLAPNTFRAVMRDMVDAGMAVRGGIRRGTRYFPPDATTTSALAQVLDQLRAHPGGLTARELGARLGISPRECRVQLRRALANGSVRREGTFVSTRYVFVAPVEGQGQNGA